MHLFWFIDKEDEMYFKTSDNIKLFYTDTQGEGKTLLCIPGLGSSHKLWEPLIQLLKNQYRIIVADPRNQGLSQRTEQGQTIKRHAQDVHELLAYLGLKDVVGIGNSMGASTLFAYQNIYGAGQLSSLIDLDQSPKMIADKTWQFGFKDLNINNFPDYLKEDFGKPHYAHLNHEMVAKAKQEYKQHPYNPADNFAFLVDHASKDWRSTLRNLTIPLLVLAGDHSPYFDYHFAKAIANYNPLISSQIIKDCGHLIQAEQPAILTRIINNFVK